MELLLLDSTLNHRVLASLIIMIMILKIHHHLKLCDLKLHVISCVVAELDQSSLLYLVFSALALALLMS